MDIRVGVGQDSHIFGTELGMTIGGILIENQREFKANSDGDVVLHALFNSLSSAMGGRSISITADPMCLEQGITNSKEYLKVLLAKIESAGYRINNVSISIECQQPKIEPLVDKMKAAISELLKIESKRIGITATSGEGLTAVGRGEGVQCFVISSLVQMK